MTGLRGETGFQRKTKKTRQNKKTTKLWEGPGSDSSSEPDQPSRRNRLTRGASQNLGARASLVGFTKRGVWRWLRAFGGDSTGHEKKKKFAR